MNEEKKHKTPEDIFEILSRVCWGFKKRHHFYTGELPDLDDVEHRLILSNVIERALEKYKLIVTVPHTLWGVKQVKMLAEKIAHRLNSGNLKKIRSPIPDLTVNKTVALAARVRRCPVCGEYPDAANYCSCREQRWAGWFGMGKLVAEVEEEIAAEKLENNEENNSEKTTKNNVILMFGDENKNQGG